MPKGGTWHLCLQIQFLCLYFKFLICNILLYECGNGDALNNLEFGKITSEVKLHAELAWVSMY